MKKSTGMMKKRTFCFLVLMLQAVGLVQAGPDSFTPAKKIAAGYHPAIAIDKQAKKVHLVYVSEQKLWYREGNLDGDFEAPEEILETKHKNKTGLWQPQIVLDETGVPHVIVQDQARLWQGIDVFYFHRLGGKWSTKFLVANRDQDKFFYYHTPRMVIQNNTAYVGLFGSIGERGKEKITSQYFRIGDLSTAPKVVQKIRNNNFGVLWPLLNKAGDLVSFTGAAWADPWKIETLDKKTLQVIGSPEIIIQGKTGQQAGVSRDESGDFHMAGAAADQTANGDVWLGWYQTLSGAKSNKEPIYYKTTNVHEVGAGLPIRDVGAKDRVYIAYWSGGKGVNRKEIFACCNSGPANQIQFARIENGKLVSENKKTTLRKGSHGNAFRTFPAMEPNPEGGMILIFSECQKTYAGARWYPATDKENTLYFTKLGESGKTTQTLPTKSR